MYKRLICLFSIIILPYAAQAEQIRFTILQANDVYEMSPVNGGRYGGLARVKTLMNELQAENPNFISVLAGDLFSPSAIGTAKVDGEPLNGRQMVDVLNHMGWDYFTLGNHEFDNGEGALIQRLSEARFKTITSNVRQASTCHFKRKVHRASACKLFANTQDIDVINLGGIKVGLAAVTLQALAKDFAEITDPMKEARRAIKRLRRKQADVILMITHQGMEEDKIFAESVKGINLILGGHEHDNNYVRRGTDFTPVAKADSNARSVYIHRVSYDTETARVDVVSELKIVDASIPEDPEIKEIVDDWTQKAFDGFREAGADPDAQIATATEDLDGLEASVRNKSTRFTQLVAQSAIRALPGSELSVVNGGGIRIDDILAAGQTVTGYDMIRTFPFSDTTYAQAKIKGETLQKAFDQGNASAGAGSYLHHANVTQDAGGTWLIDNKALDPERIYTVAIMSFLIDYGDDGLGMLVTSNNPDVQETNMPRADARDALVRELQATYP
ncbi:MAG: bifunctional metallophosphatase/5'-nucleotidase [Pseudomonadota bacterium]